MDPAGVDGCWVCGGDGCGDGVEELLHAPNRATIPAAKIAAVGARNRGGVPTDAGDPIGFPPSSALDLLGTSVTRDRTYWGTPLITCRLLQSVQRRRPARPS